ncbi:hypothetical protein BSIN_1562 [Burkholderia singularis]|uniref:Uncharacterized protein n=1 Tax=Burkholderia singularis TaxID=1503053 RepID=A0A238GZ65_9BURK|nr:hypothetical protein BSIN_1562 [Burkholderia singularis]
MLLCHPLSYLFVIQNNRTRNVRNRTLAIEFEKVKFALADQWRSVG